MNGRNKKNIYTIAICIILLVAIGLVLIATRDTNDYVQRSNDLVEKTDNVQLSDVSVQTGTSLKSDSSEIDIEEPDLPMTDAFDGSITYKGKKYEVSLSVEVVKSLLLNSLEIQQLDILGYY